jgi:hypothetical protein
MKQDVFFVIPSGASSVTQNISLDFPAVQYTVLNIIYPSMTIGEEIVIIWASFTSNPIGMATSATSNRGAGAPKPLASPLRNGAVKINILDANGAIVTTPADGKIGIQIEFSSTLDV